MRLTADSWDAYPARYEAKRRQAENRRQRRRDARKRKAAGRRPAAACDEAGQKHALLGELARERVASRGAAVAARLREGFQWPGGAVAGNPRYFLRAFVTPGLPSEAHPLLRLFVAQLPRACRLLTGDDKARVSGTDSKLLALDCPYVYTTTLTTEIPQRTASVMKECGFNLVSTGVVPTLRALGAIAAWSDAVDDGRRTDGQAESIPAPDLG